MKNSIKLSLLALTIAQTLAVQTAYAAETDEEKKNEEKEIETISVKGFGGSLGKALREKRFSPSTVEIISSDDLGALPDVSITDSLVRLPGIAASRDRGNASRISIRGMGPRLNVATMNDREIVSAEPTRDVRFEQFPAELIDGVEVYKSPLASKAEGGISGLVNMNFVSPLSKEKRLINFGASYMYNMLADDLPDADGGGYKANFSIVDQVSEKFGYAFGLTYQDQPSIEKGIQSWDYNNGVNRGDMNENGKVEDAPWGVMAKSKRGNNERNGGLLILEIQPTDSLNITGDLFYSKFDIEELDDQQGPNDLGNWADGGSGPTGWGYGNYHNTGLNPVIEDSGDGSEQVVAGVQAWGGTQFSVPKWFQQNEMLSSGIKLIHIGEVWTSKFDLGVSQASIESVWVNIEPLYDNSADYLVGYSVAGGKAQPLKVGGINDADRITLDGATMTGGGERELTDEMGNINLDFERDLDFGVLSEVSFGARVTDRTKENVQLADWVKTANAEHGLTDFGKTYSIGSEYAFDPSVFGNDPAWQDLVNQYQITSEDLSPQLYTFKDWNKVANAAFGGTSTPSGATVDNIASWKLKEKNTAVYIQLDMVGDIAGIPFSGNFGVRYAKTEVESSGHEMVSNGWVEAEDGTWYEDIEVSPASVEHEYDEFLPSLNMIFNITTDSQIRLGLARTMSRPPLLEMRTGFSFNTQTVPYTASGGNPKLDPYVANQLDLGYEYYWGDNSTASINYFYKDLQSHIGITEGTLSFNNEDYAFTGTMNGEGGVIQGIEVLYQQSFDMLPAPFDGLGIFANYSYTDSEVEEFKPENNPYNLGGLSEHIGSATLWYDKNGFDARISVNYRSEYTGINSWLPQNVNLNSSETTADASLGYYVNDNLKITLQAQNLTNESSVNYWDNDTSKPAYNVQWGRRYLVGFQYSM